MHPSQKLQIGYGIMFCDIASRKYINKCMPNDVLVIIYNILKKFPYNPDEYSNLIDYDIITKGAKKKKWRNYNQGKTKYRLKQAFRYGR